MSLENREIRQIFEREAQYTDAPEYPINDITAKAGKAPRGTINIREA